MGAFRILGVRPSLASVEPSVLLGWLGGLSKVWGGTCMWCSRTGGSGSQGLGLIVGRPGLRWWSRDRGWIWGGVWHWEVSQFHLGIKPGGSRRKKFLQVCSVPHPLYSVWPLDGDSISLLTEYSVWHWFECRAGLLVPIHVFRKYYITNQNVAVLCFTFYICNLFAFHLGIGVMVFCYSNYIILRWSIFLNISLWNFVPKVPSHEHEAWGLTSRGLRGHSVVKKEIWHHLFPVILLYFCDPDDFEQGAVEPLNFSVAQRPIWDSFQMFDVIILQECFKLPWGEWRAIVASEHLRVSMRSEYPLKGCDDIPRCCSAEAADFWPSAVIVNQN